MAMETNTHYFTCIECEKPGEIELDYSHTSPDLTNSRCHMCKKLNQMNAEHLKDKEHRELNRTRRVVLAEWRDDYVTWVWNGQEFLWGHYFKTLEEAEKDFAAR